MNKLGILKKVLSLVTCSALAAGAVVFTAALNTKAPTKVSAKTLAEIQEERDANNAKIADYEYQLSQLEGSKQDSEAYQQTLNEQITLIKSNIDSLNLELNKLNDDIITTQANIENLEKTITEQQAAIDQNVEVFKDRLRDMYVSGNDSLASLVLGSSSFYDIMSQVETANRMADYDEKLINGILDDIDNLEQSKKELESDKLTLEMKKEDQENKKAQKDAELAQLNEKMQQTTDEINRIALEQQILANDKAALDEYNAGLDAEEASIMEAIKKAAEAEAARKAAEAEAARLAAQQTQSYSNDNSYSAYTPSAPTYVETTTYASGFAWPAPGFYYISSPYGPRWGTFHSGIDIGDSGIHGGAACASQSGTVIGVYSSCSHDYAKSSSCGCGGGYGNYVLISHDGTYSTMYAHLASVCVSVGDTVSQGQTIGYIGCTGFSTGSHLHFEVRVNGSAQNPMNFVG